MDDNAVNKPEQTQKEPLDDRKRDRGDNLKKLDGAKGKISDGTNPKVTREVPLPDQGDVFDISKVTKIRKAIINTTKITADKTKKPNEIKPKVRSNISSKINTATEKTQFNRHSENIYAAVNKTKIVEKNVSDKVSPRTKALNNQNEDVCTSKNTLKSDQKNDRMKNQPNLKSSSKEIMSDLTKLVSTKTETDLIKIEKDKVHRKPLIKTVKSKNDNRIYKAVTFTEQKRIKPTILEINIPNIQAKKMKTKLDDENLETNLASVQGSSNNTFSKIRTKTQYNRRNRLTERTSERTKFKKLDRCISSPNKFKKVESPPTEVAKWAPSCLNTHTKPYYEAWVNTTLAAISKLSKNDKLFFEKQSIIKTFQKSLELGMESPTLVNENYADERYTGKIKIKHKNLSKKRRQTLTSPLIDINNEHVM